MRTIFAAVVAALVFATAHAAAAPEPGREFAFGAGYSHLFFDGEDAGGLEEQGGFHADVRFTWPVSPRLPGLRWGAGAGLTFYLSDEGGDDEFDDDFFFLFPFPFRENFAQLTLFSPNVEVSWRRPIGDAFYLEPGVAVDLLVGNYFRGDQWFVFYDADVSRWTVGVAGRAFLRAAYARDDWSIGVEFAYSYGYLDFDHDVGGETEQAYVGLFFTHTF